MKFNSLLVLFCLCMSLAFGQLHKTSPNVQLATTTQPISLQTRAVLSRPEGLLAVYNTQLVQYDTTLKALWEIDIPTIKVIHAFDASHDRIAVIGINSKQDRVLILNELKENGQELSRVTLGQINVVQVGILADKSIVTVTDSAGLLQLTNHDPKGAVRWTQKIAPDKATQPHLLALPSGDMVLTASGEVWGLNKNGKTIWHFESDQDQVLWRNLKVLKNEQVLLIGNGTAAAFNPSNMDGRIMQIDPKTGKQIWLKILGDYKTKQMAIDAIEQADGSLLVLLQESTGGSIIKINNQHEASRVGVLPPPFKEKSTEQYYQLLAVGKSYAVFGLTSTSLMGLNESSCFLQTWGGGALIVPIQKNKPNLFGLVIGIGQPSVQFTTNDAKAIAQALKDKEGTAFDTVRIDILHTAAQTTAGSIAAAVERWPLAIKPQADDWLVLYVSGMNNAYRTDYRLLGSDYDPAAPRSTSVSLRAMLNDLKTLPCHKLVLLDVCQKATIQPFEASDFANTSILLACQSGAVAYEDKQWQHGAFTKVLLDGLDGKADANQDQQLYLSELYAYLSETIPALTRKALGRLQQPSWLLKGKDEVLLRK